MEVSIKWKGLPLEDVTWKKNKWRFFRSCPDFNLEDEVRAKVGWNCVRLIYSCTLFACEFGSCCIIIALHCFSY